MKNFDPTNYLAPRKPRANGDMTSGDKIDCANGATNHNHDKNKAGMPAKGESGDQVAAVSNSNVPKETTSTTTVTANSAGMQSFLVNCIQTVCRQFLYS